MGSIGHMDSNKERLLLISLRSHSSITNKTVKLVEMSKEILRQTIATDAVTEARQPNLNKNSVTRILNFPRMGFCRIA